MSNQIICIHHSSNHILTTERDDLMLNPEYKHKYICWFLSVTCRSIGIGACFSSPHFDRMADDTHFLYSRGERMMQFRARMVSLFLAHRTVCRSARQYRGKLLGEELAERPREGRAAPFELCDDPSDGTVLLALGESAEMAALMPQYYDRGSRAARVRIMNDINAVSSRDAEDRLLIAEINAHARQAITCGCSQQTTLGKLRQSQVDK
jgi:hypothetical protein